MVNFALSDGVADLHCWHDRLGHLCPQYIKKMADEGLVKGITLRKRQFDMCEACQLGKQRAKTPAKHLDRNVKKRNQLVFADLLFPPSNYNCIRFSAVLVIMEVHTRFMTIYPVKTKFSKETNPLMRRYIAWVERQWPQDPVKEVFTDGGDEFDNAEMTTWYQRHGIMFTTTPSHTSRLNMVERSHQTLTGMLKSMMKESGLPTSFRVDALHYAVYIKNRTYSNAINGIPYEVMWNRTPDIHHLRKFGALAYVHTKVGAARHKFADNCKDSCLDTKRDSSDAKYIFLRKEQSNTVAKLLSTNKYFIEIDLSVNTLMKSSRGGQLINIQT
ncbi:LOW QUALITY PROTEIN: Hypothetical protein PHPALM_8799 [Phytophthora palmivora]|uniref:Integrase catalytic domain-containing protein n=1 Tax=Phytophthora palmivora TaxID=4796 RepID=A0A2P4Y8Y6_9STRA|nr:LOW QUALITY PROTEIN: Hypothetical protein PHPALM_8799 [Phytophthora palmivora]